MKKLFLGFSSTRYLYFYLLIYKIVSVCKKYCSMNSHDALDLQSALDVAHFPNSCKTSSSMYSCAIDCFLELAYRVFLPELQVAISFDEMGPLFQLLVVSGSQEIQFVSSSSTVSAALTLLKTIREPIWQKIIENCPSFVNKDCNAQFSEIFSSNFFVNMLSDHEKDIFLIVVKASGNCTSCNISKEKNVQTIVSYLGEFDYPQLLEQPVNNDDWVRILVQQIHSLGCSVCDVCSISIPPNIDIQIMLPKFLIVEFDAVIASKRFNFFEEIIVDNFIYNLSVFVRIDIGHFS